MLDSDILGFESLNVFKSKVLKFIRPEANSMFNCFNPKGVKLITILRLGLSHLRDHMFKHSFQDCLNPICRCGIEVETTAHYRFHCPNYLIEKNPFWTTSTLSFLTFWNKVTLLLITFFCLVIPV